MPWTGDTTPIEWASKMKDAPREAINAFAFAVFSRVVMRTPVDTGAARQNWLVSINAETDECDEDKTTGNVLADGGAVIQGAKGDDTIFIQNSLPYVPCLEYGLYPNPPKKGGVTRNGEPKTVGGFSRQAVHGMVGVTLAKADQLFEAALAAVKGSL